MEMDMKNSVVASVAFSFKGETHAPSMQLDLDPLMKRAGSLSNLHHTIAMANSIDSYSYEYEMMMSEEIHYDQPEGLAVGFVADGKFDVEGFSAKWHETQVLEAVRPIAEQCIGVTDLDARPKLKAALMQAYLAGKASA
jgi:hypothetical protein